MLLPRKDVEKYVKLYYKTNDQVIRDCIISHSYSTAISLIKKNAKYMRMNNTCFHRNPDDIKQEIMVSVIHALERPEKYLLKARCIPVYLTAIILGTINKCLERSSVYAERFINVEEVEILTVPEKRSAIHRKENEEYLRWIVRRVNEYKPSCYLNEFDDIDFRHVIDEIIAEIKLKGLLWERPDAHRALCGVARKCNVNYIKNQAVLHFLLRFYLYDVGLFLRSIY